MRGNAGDVLEEGAAQLPISSIIQQGDHCWQQEVVAFPTQGENKIEMRPRQACMLNMINCMLRVDVWKEGLGSGRVRMKNQIWPLCFEGMCYSRGYGDRGR